MARIWSRWETVLVLSLAVAAGQAACGFKPGGSDLEGPGEDGTGGTASDGGLGGDASGGQGGIIDDDPDPNDPDASASSFDVEPAGLQTITVIAGQSSPVVAYEAKWKGQPVNVGWSVDRGDIGTIAGAASSTASFVPTGKVGGLVKVAAGLNGQTIERQILVRLVAEQNGFDAANPAVKAQIATEAGKLKDGGGVGGVGGEGLGPAITDTATLDALSHPSSTGQAEELRYLYPYDQTVWPRGLLAPLLMWDWALGDADGIRIELETSHKSFSWTGTFGRPAILQQTGGKFVRHPIPQDVWEMATNTAGSPTIDNTPDRLTVRLTVSKDGEAYGPIAQTWTIAPARLSGIIYYNSYGTQLAKNHGDAIGGDGRFGGAVLSIHVGDTGPKLVAGSTTANTTGCRVCHSVAPSGSRLVVQHGNDTKKSSAYDLDPNGGSVEHVLANGAEFAGIYSDGSMALTSAGKLISLPDDSTPLPVSGLANVTTNLGTPKFSPDGKRVVFNPMEGPGVTNPRQKLVVMDFDAATGAFSNDVTVVDYTGQSAQTRPGWPAFLPDGASVVFHRQSAAGIDGNTLGALVTRKGAKAQIHWTSATNDSNVTPLNRLNGLDEQGQSYLPKLKAPISMGCTGDGSQVGSIDADHGDDVNLNYEPTVNPIASGGYAWVVFTSRRMYGSVANIPPFCSDPRGVNLIDNITTKKLWVAAIDLNAQPGKDASHPAFYLPGQELLAGNSLGFWVLDPCKTDGESCQSGDQCCGGYCRPNGEGGSLVCSDAPPDAQCSGLREKCESRADCCDSTNLCVNGFCAEQGPK